MARRAERLDTRVGMKMGLTSHAKMEQVDVHEPIYGHPRNPYVRVDALRSHRHIRVGLDGAVLADTRSPVLLFETGLPTRYYIDPADVSFEYLEPTSTQTLCPYKGVTSAYWSVRERMCHSSPS